MRKIPIGKIMIWTCNPQKDKVEEILEAGHIDVNEVEFIQSLLPEIENERIRNDLEEYLESIALQYVGFDEFSKAMWSKEKFVLK